MEVLRNDDNVWFEHEVKMTKAYDWPGIRARWEHGETPGQISRSLGGRPTRQAIDKCAKREDWRRQQISVASITDGALKPFFDGLSFEQGVVIQKVCEGWTQRMAADYAGVNEATVSRWKKLDKFVKALSLAIAVKNGNRLKKIEDSGDWRAAMALLERDSDSRGEFAPPSSGRPTTVGNTFNILGKLDLGIQRDRQVIDARPQNRIED